MSFVRLLAIDNDASALEAFLKDNLDMQAMLKTRYSSLSLFLEPCNRSLHQKQRVCGLSLAPAPLR